MCVCFYKVKISYRVKNLLVECFVGDLFNIIFIEDNI